ncbi:diguanylate cyclase [Anaerobacillus sp. HL2]|nr:diguanylate cyclase [Anaerobacillus sp. HL2]
MSTLGIIIDVTEEIKEKIKLMIAIKDMMTNIYNRGAFERNVTRLLEETSLDIAAFIMLDLDYLKLVNDTYGHKCGDVYDRQRQNCCLYLITMVVLSVVFQEMNLRFSYMDLLLKTKLES